MWDAKMKRAEKLQKLPFSARIRGGGGRIRTIEAITQQIYSLPPLASRELPRMIQWSVVSSHVELVCQPAYSRLLITSH